MNETIKEAQNAIGSMLPDEKTWIEMVETVSLLGVARIIFGDPRAGMVHTASLVAAAGIALGALAGDSDIPTDEVAETFAEAMREGVKLRQKIIDGAAKTAVSYANNQGFDIGGMYEAASSAIDAIRKARTMH